MRDRASRQLGWTKVRSTAVRDSGAGGGRGGKGEGVGKERRLVHCGQK